MKSVRLGACLLGAVAVSGCLASTTLINVKPDGSGTVEQTTTMRPEAIKQMMEMISAFGETTTGQPKPQELFSEKEAAAAAAKMGPGVRYVSSTRIKTPEAEGLKAVYAFDDVRTLRIDQKPKAPMEGSPGAAPGGAPNKPEEVTFKLTRQTNGNSLLTVSFPLDPEKGIKLQKEEKPAAPAEELPPQAVEMMKEMFQGLRIEILMQVVGQLVRTNSAYVDGNKVTLLSIDFEKILANEAVLKQIQNPQSIEEAKALLKKIPGIKVNLEKDVTVEFR